METGPQSRCAAEENADRRRRLRRVVLHFGFAVLFTVVSALVCARFVFFASVSVTIDRSTSPPTQWPGPAPEGWPETPHAGTDDVVWLDSADWWLSPGRWVWHVGGQKLLPIGELQLTEPLAYARTLHGFPIPSMMTDWAGPTVGGTMWKNDARWPYSGVPVMRALPATTPLFIVPLVPWWPGFLANTLLIAGMTLGVQAAVRWVRRRRRRMRGLCVFCGYELAGGGKCPECGGENAAVDAEVPAVSGVP